MARLSAKRDSGVSLTATEEVQVNGVAGHWRGFAFSWIVGLTGLALVISK